MGGSNCVVIMGKDSFNSGIFIFFVVIMIIFVFVFVYFIGYFYFGLVVVYFVIFYVVERRGYRKFFMVIFYFFGFVVVYFVMKKVEKWDVRFFILVVVLGVFLFIRRVKNEGSINFDVG